MEMACPFANLLVKDPPNNPYRENFKRCNGDLVPVNECKDEIDKEHGERYIILVRSGYINQYEKLPSNLRQQFSICENHRKLFGRGFIRELRQRSCIYPEHDGGRIENWSDRGSF